VPAPETGLPASYHYRGLRTFGPFSDRPQSPLAAKAHSRSDPGPAAAASRGGPGLPYHCREPNFASDRRRGGPPQERLLSACAHNGQI